MNATTDLEYTGTITTNGTVHYGTAFGPYCGAGFNRKGAKPQVHITPNAAITCTRKACAKYAK